MAFKKTGGRKVYVQPTGMPDFSGFQQAARSYDQLGQRMYNRGTQIRQGKLNELILEAEMAGSTAGATYDKDGNIVPLTNLNVGEGIAGQVGSENERKALNDAYRRGAIKTYSVSVTNAAEGAATDAFAQNPDNPSAVLSAQEGFIKSLNLPPDIAPFVMPGIVRKFTIAHSKANAGLIDKNQKEQVAQNLQNINSTFTELAILHSKGAPADSAAEAGHTAMISELTQEIEGSFEVLKEVGGYTDVDIDKLRVAGQTQIQMRMGVSHIERLYSLPEEEGGGYLAALKELSALSQSFEGLAIEGVDVGAIEQAMRNRLNVLKNIDDEALRGETKRQAENYSNLYLVGVLPGNSLTPEMILTADVSNPQKASLYQLLENRSLMEANNRTKMEKNFQAVVDEEFERLMIPIDNDLSPEDIEKSAVLISDMYNNPENPMRITAKQFSRFVTSYKKVLQSALNKEADATMAAVEAGMRNYILTVDDLVAATPTLIEKGLVGGDSKITEDAWQKRITSYGKERASQSKKAKELSQARTAVLNGTANAGQVRLLSDSLSFNLSADTSGETILHSDGQIRDENMTRMVNFSLAYRTLHADARDFLSNPAFDAGGERGIELVEQKAILFDQMFSSLVKGGMGEGSTDMAIPHIEAIALMEQSGIDTMAYQMIRTQGAQAWLDSRKAMSTTEGRRRLSDVENQLGMSIDEAVVANFTAAIEPSGMFRTMGDHINSIFGWGSTYDRRDRFSLNQMSQLPAGADGSYEGALIEDPRFIRLMRNEVSRLIVQTKANISEPQQFQALLSKAVINVGDKIGASIDSTGTVYYELNPWYKAASASVGDAVTGGKSVPELVFSDIRQKVLNMPLLDDRTRDLLNDDDNPIRLVPEMMQGGDQTYLVQVQDIDTGINYNIKSGYRYDWSTSIDNGAYIAATQRVTNSTVQKFLAVAPFIKRAFVENQMRNIIGDYNDDANWIGYVEPEGRVGLKEEWRNITTVLKQAYNMVMPYDDFPIDEKFDAGDVKILRDWLRGDFANDEDYIEELRGYYGELD